jgi:hypothetical protein
MKKIVMLLSLLLTTSIFAEGFGNVQWGANYATIKKSEKGKKLKQEKLVETYGDYEWNETIYSLEKDLKSAGKFKMEYVLLKDRLIKGSYSQEIKNENLDNYNKIKKILFDKYGVTQNRYQTSFYKLEDKKEIRNTKEILSWDTKDTRIELVLINKEKFEINYYTRNEKLLDFIKETGLEKKRKEEKELLKDSEYIEKFL